jgi:formylglycine-generating enzyme required for sulfatase activity
LQPISVREWVTRSHRFEPIQILVDPNTLLRVKDQPMVSLQTQNTSRTAVFEAITRQADGQPISRRSLQAHVIDIGLDPILSLVAIPGGTFQMGAARSDGLGDAQPQHIVSVSPFYLAQGLTSQALWKAVMGRPPHCRFKGDLLPVENVSYADTQGFCHRLARLTGLPFRLPSEAEWEYACRAGMSTPFSTGETITSEDANYCAEHTFAGEPAGEYRHTTTPAGSFPPNPFGIFDLHGNLWEWCADVWHADYTAAPFGGQVWESGGEAGIRVARGGSWHEPPANCRTVIRLRTPESERDDFYGFRVALDGSQIG